MQFHETFSHQQYSVLQEKYGDVEFLLADDLASWWVYWDHPQMQVLLKLDKAQTCWFM